jgi:hypothetical protein
LPKEKEEPKEIVLTDNNSNDLKKDGKEAVDEVVNGSGATTLRIRGATKNC